MICYRIGVDGGGTTTRAVVIDATHNLVFSRGHSGSSNLWNTGLEGALENIRMAIAEALERAGMVVGQIETFGFGLAGASGESEKEMWTGALRAIYGEHIRVDEDVAAALVGAFGPDELSQSGGAVLIAGTGANCFGQNADGGRVRVDGWGPMLGDRGSGFWLGESAIRAGVAAVDGAGESTTLGAALLEHFAVFDLNALVGVVYAPTFARDRIAAFVPLVLNTARDGDEVSQRLLNEAGVQLASTARAVLQPLELHELALTGGLLENAPEVRQSLADALPGVELIEPRFEPVVGAALLPLVNL